MSKEHSCFDDENKSRDQLIRELAEIRTQLAAQTQECTQLKSLQEQHSSSGSKANKTEEWLSRIFENHPDALVVSRVPDGTIMRVNPAFTRLFGYAPEDVIGKNSIDLGMIEKTERQEIIEELMIHGCVRRREAVTRTREGAIRAVSLSMIQMECEEPHVITIIQDITERKLDEERLHKALKWAKESERVLNALMEHIPEGITIADAPDVNIRRVSRYGQSLTGKSRGTLEGIPANQHAQIWGIYLPDGKTPAENEHLPLTRATQKGEIVKDEEFVLANPDGTRIPILCNAGPIRNDAGQIIGGVIAWRDVTERKKFEDALRESEQRYRTLFNTMDEAFVLNEMIEDEAGEIDFLFVDANPACEKHSGLRDVMGKTMRQVMPCTAAKLIERYTKVIRTGGQIRFEDYVADLDRWFDIFAWRVGEAENRRVAMLFTDITERKHAEDALREYRAKLEAALASMTDAVCISDLEGRFFEFNDAFATFHKFTDKKECLKKLSEYPEILDVFMADGESAPLEMWAVSRALRGETATSAEYTLRRKDTGETWVGSYSFGPIRDGKGKIVGSVVVARDITEQKRSEQALRDSESFYRQTLESIPGMVFTTRPDGYCDYQSQQWVDYTGIPTIEQLGNGWNKLLHPEDQPRAMATWRNAVEGKAPYNLEYRVRRYDGAYEWFRVIGRPIRDAEGIIVRWFGVAMNMEEHKKTEQALLANSARLGLLATVAERLLRAEDPQVVIQDLCRLVLVHLNCEFFLNYFAKPPEQKLHLNAYAGILREAVAEIHDFDFGMAVCGSVASLGERVIVENIQNSDDPRTQLLKSYGVQAYCCHPLMTQDRLIGTLSFGTLTRQAFTDDEIALMKSISDQVAVAMQRLEAEKALLELNQTLMQQVAERTALAEGRAKQLQALAVELIEAEEKERQRISLLLHEDFQQLLASAKMQLQAACETLPPNTFIVNVEHLLAECLVKSRRLSQDLSPPILQNSSIVQSLEWLIAKMRAQFGLCVDIKTQDVGFPENKELKVFLFQAVKELLFNVVQHSGAKKASVDFCRSENGFVLTVSDQGKGFDPTILDGVKNATGLGLASLRERISYIGGELLIKSSPGEGCRLTLKLPFSTATVEPLRAVEPALLSERKHKEKKIKVIIADDHKVMRQGLVKMISCQPDIQVIGEAANGPEAIELARRLNPDLILMDISMPGIDGIEATRIVKAEMPNVRVIGLSMFEDEQMEQEMLQLGAEAFISKASSIHEMLKAIYGFSCNT